MTDDTTLNQSIVNSALLDYGYDIIYGTDERDDIFEKYSVRNTHVFSFDGSDSIYTGSGNDHIFAGAGHDNIFSGSGNDLVFGDSGNDAFWYQGGHDSYFGGSGRDTTAFHYMTSAAWIDLTYNGGEAWTRNTDNLTSGAWEKIVTLRDIEAITGTKYDDYIAGDSSNNTLAGGEGDDRLYGRDGHDFLAYSSGRDILDGGDGNDTAYFGGFQSAVWVDLEYNGAEAWTKDSNDLNNGAWREIADLNDIENVRGTEANDEIYGDSHSNHLFGNGGNDEIDGRGGDDVIEGGDGYDVIRGGEGDDTISGGRSNDLLAGNYGHDRIYGGEGDDILSGNQGDDILYGGAGDDLLMGDNGTNDGQDHLHGGSGADRFSLHQVNDSPVTDIIHDFNAEEGDILQIIDFTADPYDELQGAIDQFVSFRQNGNNVDLLYSSGEFSPGSNNHPNVMATLKGADVSDFNVQELFDSGQLVVDLV